MSDKPNRSKRASRRSRRRGADRGLTLPELLITMVVIGMVGAVLTAGVSVTLRQHEATRGRLDVARWEQNLGMWLPDDLSSASETSDEPNVTPCGSSKCGGVDMSTGSNVLLLSWDDGGITTTVSYRYMPDGDSGSYGLFRVECTGGSCESARVLGDLAAPPAGWKPGQDAPEQIIDVEFPISADGNDSDTIDDSVGKRRIVVSVNGQVAVDGIDRSSRVSLAAGGTKLSTLEPATFSGPSFVQARSDCGGPITLIVDSSGSIGSDMASVKKGVKQFVNTFDGTPTKLQIIDFDSTARVLGAGTGWNMYYDLSEPGTAAKLNKLVDGITSDSYTNWEDALFRAFYTSGGVPYSQANNPATPMPELVVFFTDGLPTKDRTQNFTGSAVAKVTLPTAYNATESYTSTKDSSDFISPQGWYRADQIADSWRGDDGDAVRMIGLGVGPSFGDSRYMKVYKGKTLTWLTGWQQVQYPHAKFLGNLVGGGDPANPNDNPYVRREYSASSGWGDVSTADLLVASDFTKFADALSQIALSECGGTLTVQTRLVDGTTAPLNLTYTAEGEQVVTSRVAKSGTFDIDLAGKSSKKVTLVPSAGDLTTAGYTPTSWTCRSGGVDLVQGTDYKLVKAGDLTAGVDLTVTANGAVSCTLTVKK